MIKYWKTVAENVVQWVELSKREISKVDLRENYIVTQGVVIQAFGVIGLYFYKNPEIDMTKFLCNLQKKIDWKKKLFSVEAESYKG